MASHISSRFLTGRMTAPGSSWPGDSETMTPTISARCRLFSAQVFGLGDQDSQTGAHGGGPFSAGALGGSGALVPDRVQAVPGPAPRRAPLQVLAAPAVRCCASSATATAVGAAGPVRQLAAPDRVSGGPSQTETVLPQHS